MWLLGVIDGVLVLCQTAIRPTQVLYFPVTAVPAAGVHTAASAALDMFLIHNQLLASFFPDH